MQRADIIIGEEYALRENRQLAGPLQRVRIVQHVRGTKWRAEWVEPDPGLVDYVDGRTLLVRWSESEAFIADERSELLLREDNEANLYDDESPLAGALYTVFDAAGDRMRFYRGDLSGPPSALERVRRRARVEPRTRAPLEYVDRHGVVHLPFVDAVALARAFCEAEADTVIVYLELSDHVSVAPDLFAKGRAADALVLEWCGTVPSALPRRANERLRKLVVEAADALEKAGREEAARALRQEVDAIGGSSASSAASGSEKRAALEGATWTSRGRVRRE